MDIGKRSLKIAKVYSGNTEAALSDIVLAIAAIGEEAEVTAGFATLTCLVNIARGQAVSIQGGKLRLASAITGIPAIGVCVNAALAGQKARIILGSGLASGLSGLTVDASVYLGNAGALLFAKPASGMIQGLGIALSATEMFVTISQP